MGAQVNVPSSGQWDLISAQGQTYRIQISWPMHWEDRTGRSGVPVFYLVDGNANFLSATEAAWRRATGPHFKGGGIVVAIGYPVEGRVYSPRRQYDLTPPGPSSSSVHGGADQFLDFIQNILKPFVATMVFPGLIPGREALFGHSFGGLLALYALFTRPTMFDYFVASSPSIYWQDCLISNYERRFCNNDEEGGGSADATTHVRTSDDEHIPILAITYGEYEQNPPRWFDETEQEYEKRRKAAQSWAMKDNAGELYDHLRRCPRLANVTLKEYPAEDHGTVIACALSRSLTTFCEEWRPSGK